MPEHLSEQPERRIGIGVLSAILKLRVGRHHACTTVRSSSEKREIVDKRYSGDGAPRLQSACRELSNVAAIRGAHSAYRDRRNKQAFALHNEVSSPRAVRQGVNWVRAMVLPSGSLTQAARKSPASKMPRPSVVMPGWS